MMLNGPKRLKASEKRPKLTHSGPKCFKIVTNSLSWMGTAENDLKCSETAQDSLWWCKMLQNDPECSKVAQDPL
jgi:hypothetical protein